MNYPAHVRAAEVGAALREMTANLMLVARGGGKAHHIARDAGVFVAALRDYHEVTGRLPSPEALSASLTALLGPTATESHYDVIRGALRISAAQLRGDERQEALGQRELARARSALEGERGVLQS